MAFKISKDKGDGRINTFGIRILDGEEVTVEDEELAERFREFGYVVEDIKKAPAKKPRRKT